MSIHLFCLPRKKSLNLQVEIILGIISIITRSSLLNWPQLQHILNPALVRFPWLVELTQFSHLIFFQYNLVCFDFVQASNSQKSQFDIVLWPNCFVRGSLIGILFCVIHCTAEVYIYCSKLSAAHQGDLFTSCENIISCSQTLLLSSAFPCIDPVRVDDNVQPEGGCALEKQAFCHWYWESQTASVYIYM